MKINKLKSILSEIRSNFIQVVVTIIILGGTIFIFTLPAQNKQIYDIVVEDKYVKNYNNNSTYLVVDENNNTYKVEDMLIKLKFNSTDIYNSLDVGKKYRITTSGFRIPIFSCYQNINKIQLLEDK